MNFPFFIAKRYLIAKKSQNAINIISIIAVTGVTVGTMALIIVLSVFNGFDRLVKSLFNSFDPDLKISLNEGKVFSLDSLDLETILNTPGVWVVSEVLEENALLKYEEKQYIATVKGVDSSFIQVSGIDSMMLEGSFRLQGGELPYAVVGEGVAYYLGIILKSIEPVLVYMPRRNASFTINPDQAFKKNYFFTSGIFRIEQDFDSKYTFVPIAYLRNLLDYKNEVSALEIRLKPGSDEKQVVNQLRKTLGPQFSVKNRYEQQEFFYKVMRSEKWAIFFILTFILIIASFNIVSSLTMLILDKQKDIYILAGLGSDARSIRRIFLFEGWLISGIGALAGVVLGILICWLQIKFEFLKLQGSGSFVIDAYPVFIKGSDILIVFCTVMLIGYLAAWYPVRLIRKSSLISV